MPHPWLAERMSLFDASGIRKVFDLAARLKDPINLSIGQPHFDVPQPVKEAAIAAIREGKNAYSPTQGIAALRDRLQAQIDRQYGHGDRRVLVTSGTSGGLVLSLMTLVNPGDEVIVFDPYFVMYPALVAMMGGKCTYIDNYPDFRIPLDRVEAAITPRTKAILFNSPANPTGVLNSLAEVKALAELARRRNVALISDEIYTLFCYDEALVSPAKFNDQTIVIDGFSKTYAMTGWRLGFLHGPAELVDAMTKTQQYTFVCAPQPVQWAGLAALDVDMQSYVDDYRQKRDMLYEGLRKHYDLVRPDGAFYAFPRVPPARKESATEFVTRAVDQGLLIIPGSIFSRQDSHFRISYAADDKVLQRGIEVLQRLAH